MSKGPGILQRTLLAALEKQPAVFLADLLPAGYSAAQYSAINRAAWSLEAQGRVDIWHTGLAGGTNSMWVTRPGYSCQRDQVPRL
jgi:hypothetical protein